jgi:hypothetical protein
MIKNMEWIDGYRHSILLKNGLTVASINGGMMHKEHWVSTILLPSKQGMTWARFKSDDLDEVKKDAERVVKIVLKKLREGDDE